MRAHRRARARGRPGRALIARRARRTAAERALSADLEPWRGKFPTVEVVPRVEHCPTVPAMLDAARDALMFVIGARGHGGFLGVRLGAVALQVLEHAGTPVLVARRS
ncbi:universal stress protein [Dactylosporangium sp. McL0621]|uniref:universal stress protein n=1 Tax=Dactylosporangium sp. McL0621 TaxID=3415678 RepID=UPI003CE74261